MRPQTRKIVEDLRFFVCPAPRKRKNKTKTKKKPDTSCLTACRRPAGRITLRSKKKKTKKKKKKEKKKKKKRKKKRIRLVQRLVPRPVGRITQRSKKKKKKEKQRKKKKKQQKNRRRQTQEKTEKNGYVLSTLRPVASVPASAVDTPCHRRVHGLFDVPFARILRPVVREPACHCRHSHTTVDVFRWFAFNVHWLLTRTVFRS